MTVQLDALGDAPLAPAANDEFYDLYRAAVEWRLASPIAIRSADDILSSATWKDRVQPFHHQVQNLITFCRIAPAALIADEVGLGKTISAGLILSELMVRRRVARALVLCPKVICGQWVAELGEKFRINARTVTGVELAEAARESEGVVVTTYETAAVHLRAVPAGAFGMLILDEAHRLRNLHGSSSPPKVASAVRDAVAARLFTYVLMLTATPVQNRFWDIYSLIDLLTLAKGHRNPFGGPADFRATYLVPGSDGRRMYPGTVDQFRQVLRGYVARTRRVDARLPFPSRHTELKKVPLTRAEREFEAIVGRVLGDVNPLVQSSLGQALMSSPAALAAQLRNMAVARSDLASAAAQAQLVAEGSKPPAKLTHLYELCDMLRQSRPDWRLVVFTGRKETLEMIGRGLRARGIPAGFIAGGRHEANRRDTAAFTVDPPLVRVLVSTDAGAEGVNLQKANIIVNYDLPWNPMILEQRIGRLQRLGSEHKEVIVFNLVAENTVEEEVVARLMEKLMTVTDTVGDVESILAGVVSGGESNRDERFEAVVRELVVKSLQGQDMTQATRLQQENIDRARQEYVQNTRQMNRDLGALDEIHVANAAQPKFERPQPSIPANQFVLRAYAAEGRPMRQVHPGVYELAAAKRPAPRLVLDPTTAEEVNGAPVHLYVPGQPAFDRLAERWAEKRSHRVIDLRPITERHAETIARQWCAEFDGVSFLSCQVRVRTPVVRGKVLVLVTVVCSPVFGPLETGVSLLKR
jgi:superfamily II DNA or RNA helicase